MKEYIKDKNKPAWIAVGILSAAGLLFRNRIAESVDFKAEIFILFILSLVMILVTLYYINYIELKTAKKELASYEKRLSATQNILIDLIEYTTAHHQR